MFASFFPRPKIFFLSVLILAVFSVAIWHMGGKDWGTVIGLEATAGTGPVAISLFWSGPFLWFYIYYWAVVALFAASWQFLAPHGWSRWSIWGSALIVFMVWFEVQVSVAANAWYGAFYNLVQAALARAGQDSLAQFHGLFLTVGALALAAVVVGAFTLFFTSHYIFRWRTAMNDHYVAHWPMLRTIEGASQRVQEDTMRFSTMVEKLGIKLVAAILTLIAFLPLLTTLSAKVTSLPLVGPVPHALVVAGLAWALFGTAFVALIGWKLPGLEFHNQRVEAAYRKELVYGEDDPERARQPALRTLFMAVRQNYFRLYFNFAYFKAGQILYLQADAIFPLIILAPTIVAGTITLGLLVQIITAFDRVRSSLQYLVNSWPDIVELLSIYNRLRGFEAAIRSESPPPVICST